MNRYTKRLEALEQFLKERKEKADVKDYEVSREELAEYLVNMRTSIGYNRPNFAKLLGINNSTLWEYENMGYYPMDVYALIVTVRERVRDVLRKGGEGVSA